MDANGRVTALQKGTAKITVTSKSNKKAKATISITVKVAPVNLDLSVYYGQNAKTVKSKLGLIEDSDNPFPHGDGEYAYAFGLHSSNRKNATPIISMVGLGASSTISGSIIRKISLYNSSKYNIYGVSCGISIKDAENILQKAGWRLVDKWNDGCEYYSNIRNINMQIDGVNGKVDFVSMYTHELYI